MTTDLAGFWERHYPAVRRELMRKYPKHFWPEDPRVAGMARDTSAAVISYGHASAARDGANVGLAIELHDDARTARDGACAFAQAAAKALKARFLEHGLQAEVMAEEIRKSTSANLMLNNLLQGFMGLGLIVGIAALGVIAARSVVERRQQIGMNTSWYGGRNNPLLTDLLQLPCSV